MTMLSIAVSAVEMAMLSIATSAVDGYVIDSSISSR